MNEPTNEPGFEAWCIVELFGHARCAGLVSERNIAGAGFIQVDVHDKTGAKVVFSRLLNPKSIYAINPVSKEIALVAGEISDRPITRFDVSGLLGPNKSDEWGEM